MTQEAAPSLSSRPRLDYLDIAKGFAAMGVVLLHLFNHSVLTKVGAPWHIWQAMPIFLLVAGITGAMSWKKYKGNIGAYYRDLPPKILALYLPYVVVVLLYHLYAGEPVTLGGFFDTLLMGYLGPGGYFVPLIVQHLIFFPLLLSVREFMKSDLSFLALALFINIILERPFALVDMDATRALYRIYYFRYLFACCLGAVLATGNPFNRNIFLALAALSAVYIGAAIYLSNPQATPPSFWNLSLLRADDWYFQHYPSYFFTAWLVFAMRDHEMRIPKVEWIKKIGKSSYDIFIFQMLFFITLVISIKKYYGWSDLPFWTTIPSFAFCIAGGLLLTHLKALWQAHKKKSAQQ